MLKRNGSQCNPELHLLLKRGMKSLYQMKIGAIFDWDGVIIDSSALHEASWEILAEEEKLSLPEGHFKKGFGRKNETIIPHVLKWTDDAAEVQRIADRKEAIYRESLNTTELKPLPGVRELLNELKSSGIPMAVGSSPPRANLEAVISILRLEGFFDHLVAAEDVGKGKPDPGVFIKAAERISCACHHCVVFEDAIYGIEAGLAGGMKVIAVATTHTIEELGQAHWAVKSLEERGSQSGEPSEPLSITRATIRVD